MAGVSKTVFRHELRGGRVGADGEVPSTTMVRSDAYVDVDDVARGVGGRDGPGLREGCGSIIFIIDN